MEDSSKDILNKLSQYKPLIWFLLNSFLLYVGWFLVYELWIHPKGTIDLIVIKNSMNLSKLFLNLLGYKIYFLHERQIFIEHANGIFIGDPCNGLNLFALFSGFIIAYPGALKSKLFYIPAGILFIHLVNVLRISFLLLLQLKAPEYMEFNHTYTFTILIYGCIFLLWIFWVNRYGTPKIQHDELKHHS
jgi:exosortase family protein XrtF